MARACIKYQPARMNKRVRIISAARTSDNQGGFTENWSVVATIWASIEPLKGWERMQAQQLQTPLTHKLTARYRSGLTTAHRLLFGTRVLDIKEVINLYEDNAFLQIMCVETLPQRNWESIVENWEDINTNWETP